MTDLAVFILGIGASCCLVASAYVIARPRLVGWMLGNAACFLTQFALLEAWGTVAIGAITALYGIICLADTRWGWLGSWWVRGGVMGAHVTAYLLVVGSFWNVQVLSLVASLATLITFSEQRPVRAKLWQLSCGLVWTVFHLCAGAYGALLGEAFFLIAGLIGLHRAKRATQQSAAVPSA